MMQVTGVVAGYGSAQILHGVSFRVEAGEVLAIVGPNGAGKSTLVGAIAGIRKLWDGSVEIEGQDVSRAPAEARVRAGIVLCPEGRRILAGLTVEENLHLGGTATGGSRREARRMTRETLGEVYERFPLLYERREQPGGTLSGGQQQLLAIGRALMARPRVLLLDEPSLGLAPQVIATAYDVLAALRSEGRAIVLVEEGARRALSFADRGVVMVNGAAVLQGPVEELAAHPELESAYLGSMGSDTVAPAEDAPAAQGAQT